MTHKIVYPLIALAGCCLIGHAAAQESRAVPDTPAQVTLSYAPVVKKVAPAVVNIYAKATVTERVSPFAGDPFFERFFGGPFGGLLRQGVKSSLGSGVIVDASGIVVTNAHVVKNAQEISVVLADGREFGGTVSLSDDQSDLAVLRIDTDGQRLPAAQLSPSETLEVGDIVLAIGNPFGVGQTVTSGIVSALARSSLSISNFNFFIQTDAAINPGNSGGPLVDMKGGVVGINTAIYSRDGGSLGIGFAVPSEMAAAVVAAEKQASRDKNAPRRVTRAWLGITAQAMTQDAARSLGLAAPSGLLVSAIHPASPALKAGMKAGDVITAINGRAVRDMAEMNFRLATLPLGSVVEFTLLRQGKTLALSVRADAPPDEPPRQETALAGPHPLDGATAARLNPALAVELGMEADSAGVAITKVDPRGRAARYLMPGDIVVSVNGDAIEDVPDLQQNLRASAGRNAWSVVLDRGGRRTQIIVR